MIVGRSAVMRELRRQIEAVSQTDTTVLIEGETGVGKELVARSLHDQSHRAGRPFVAFNASTLTEELFESELFGHVKGAFSGAHEHHPGLARAACSGSLLIDEVGEIPLINQAKLLRFLDSKEVRPVGGTRTIRVDVRILSATNRDLMAEVRKGRFRPDLYYRLRGISLWVPPLRARRGDVPLLIDHFLRQANHKHGKAIPAFSARARSLLLAHAWGGNVRELENEVERAVVLTSDGGEVAADMLSPQIREPANQLDLGAGDGPVRTRELEREYVRRALQKHGWNVTATARELGLSRVGLSKKLSRMGLRRP